MRLHILNDRYRECATSFFGCVTSSRQNGAINTTSISSVLTTIQFKQFVHLGWIEAWGELPYKNDGGARRTF